MIPTPHTLASLITCMFLAPCALAGADDSACGCSADLDSNLTVNSKDLATLLNAWGAVGAGNSSDIDGNGTVDSADLALLLNAWGDCLGPPSIVTGELAIKALGKAAYIWSLPLEFVYRFGRYNELMTAEVNTLAYVPLPAAWNNASTNAGNSTTLYINGILDLTGSTALVFTVPNSPDNFTVAQFLDGFVNTFADPGSRTSGNAAASYLLVGPSSPYAHMETATIVGADGVAHALPVIASDMNRAQVLIRVLAPTLSDAEDLDSAYNTLLNVAYGFRLNTLEEFLTSGPVAPKSFAIKSPTDAEIAQAAQWQNSPMDAVEFFEQVGAALELNDLPTQSTGLGGTPIIALPLYIVPQPGAKKTYYAPSAGQLGALTLLAPIGLSEAGYRVPCNWGPEQLQWLQEGFDAGIQHIQDNLGAPSEASMNWWTYKNSKWGTYENTIAGYQTRAVGVISGGFPSLVADGLYAAQFTEANSTDPLTGDNVYTLTIVPSDGALPADGIEPPLKRYTDGSAIGFWSVTVYQPGKGEAVCPCLSQASVLNTHYSQSDTEVLSVNTKSNTITAKVPYGSSLRASSPVLFGETAAEYGLQPRIAYFLVNDPTFSADGSTVTFQISATWTQELSTAVGDPGTPVQYSGEAGTVVALTQGTSKLTWGFVQPVSQLGSTEILKKQLRQNLDAEGNEDGSYTIWFANSIENIKGAFVENWIPTPSQDWLRTIYPNATELNSEFWPIFRIYAAQPGDLPPSILPCPDSVCDGSEVVEDQSGELIPDDAKLASYRFPLITKLPAKP